MEKGDTMNESILCIWAGETLETLKKYFNEAIKQTYVVDDEIKNAAQKMWKETYDSWFTNR